ncbi:hypothetical protein BB560_001026, partial [Smittium megazygosporum]
MKKDFKQKGFSPNKPNFQGGRETGNLFRQYSGNSSNSPRASNQNRKIDNGQDQDNNNNSMQSQFNFEMNNSLASGIGNKNNMDNMDNNDNKRSKIRRGMKNARKFNPYSRTKTTLNPNAKPFVPKLSFSGNSKSAFHSLKNSNDGKRNYETESKFHPKGYDANGNPQRQFSGNNNNLSAGTNQQRKPRFVSFENSPGRNENQSEGLNQFESTNYPFQQHIEPQHQKPFVEVSSSGEYLPGPFSPPLGPTLINFNSESRKSSVNVLAVKNEEFLQHQRVTQLLKLAASNTPGTYVGKVSMNNNPLIPVLP